MKLRTVHDVFPKYLQVLTSQTGQYAMRMQSSGPQNLVTSTASKGSYFEFLSPLKPLHRTLLLIVLSVPYQPSRPVVGTLTCFQTVH